jgi:hypothetical protein
MYDYGQRDGDTIASAGIGYYCLMGSGNHLDFGRSPSPVCSYLRDLAGWCDNEIDLKTAATGAARHGDYNTVMKYRTSKPNEYFLVENRSKMGLDRGLPASGLAVYHCDILGSNELQQGTAAKHYQCALLQADGRRDLELDANRGDGDDLFVAIQGVALSAASLPNSREWDGRDSGLAVADISGPGEVVSFKVGCCATDGARRLRSGEPDGSDSRQRDGRDFERDRHYAIGNRRGDQGQGGHRASVYRRSQSGVDLARRPEHGASSPTRRIRRQSDRHI